MLDMNDENLFLVANENGAAAGRGNDSANFDGHHVVFHTDSLLRDSKKTSLLPERGQTPHGSQDRMIYSGVLPGAAATMIKGRVKLACYMAASVEATLLA